MLHVLRQVEFLTERSIKLYADREDYRYRERNRVKNNDFTLVDVENLKAECKYFKPIADNWHPKATEMLERFKDLDDTANGQDVDDLYAQLDLAIRADVTAMQIKLESQAKALVSDATKMFPFMKNTPLRGLSHQETNAIEKKLDEEQRKAEQTIRNVAMAKSTARSLREINETHEHIDFFHARGEEARKFFVDKQKERIKVYTAFRAKQDATAKRAKKRSGLVGMPKKRRV